jgi:hypothetical protein
MNFMRGLADGMDFYRDQRSREKAMRFLSKEPRPKGGASKFILVNRIAVGSTGSISTPSATRCMPIGGALRASATSS